MSGDVGGPAGGSDASARPQSRVASRDPANAPAGVADARRPNGGADGAGNAGTAAEDTTEAEPEPGGHDASRNAVASHDDGHGHPAAGMGALALGTLGIVYGDIGTSPLYA